MPNNFTYPGLQKMSFKDFMSNDNYYNSGATSENATPSPVENTLNSMRTSKALANPYEPSAQYSIPKKAAIEETPNVISSPNETLAELPKPKGILEKITSSFERPEGTKGIFKEGSKILGMNADAFTQLAGSLAHAIAPTTPQGRVGAVLAGIAGKERERRLAEPERELTKRLTEAKISNLEKADDPKTAIAWYLKQNPKATPEDVAKFKKSLDTDQPGAYWRTTSDDGTVTIYKGGTPIHTSKPGVGKTQKEGIVATEEAGYQRESEAIGKTKATTKKTPTPVNWGTASKSLSSRFGKQDATGNFIITKDLQNLHRLAQKKLVEMKAAGADPLDAVNRAEDYARKVEESYWSYIDNAGMNTDTGKELTSEQRQANIEKTRKAFKAKFGYVPKIRPR